MKRGGLAERAADFFGEGGWGVWVRRVALTGLALFVWRFNSKGVQDALLWGVFVWALVRSPKGSPVWRCASGGLFIAALVYTVATIPLSVDPRASFRDFLKVTDLLAAAFALPILFGDARRIRTGLIYTAAGFTVLLGGDLVRLAVCLKGDLLLKAHVYEPFVLGHSPNIAALAAGLAFWIWFGAVATFRETGRRSAVAWAVVGMVVDLVYLVVIASRGAQIAFAGTAVVGGWLMLRSKRARLVWLVVVAAAGMLVAARPEWINPRFRDRISMRGFSDRDKVWSHTWALSKQRPVFGWGYGRRVFKKVYHSTNPPKSRFYFNHPHQYWLRILFSRGWVGVALFAAAWAAFGVRLVRASFDRSRTVEERWTIRTVLLLLCFLHIFGLGDYPGGVGGMMMIWLVPAGLVLTRRDERTVR